MTTVDWAEPMRVWEADGFRLEVFDAERSCGTHRQVAYRFFDSEAPDPAEPLFQGDDYGVPMHKSIDGDGSIAGLLGFLSLRPGDTDPDYFDAYTERQRDWCEARGEDLSMAALDAFGEDV